MACLRRVLPSAFFLSFPSFFLPFHLERHWQIKAGAAYARLLAIIGSCLSFFLSLVCPLRVCAFFSSASFSMNHTAAAAADAAASPHRRQSVIGDLVVAGDDDDEYTSYTL